MKIRQLIRALESFEDKDAEVMVSVDKAFKPSDSWEPICLVSDNQGHCVLTIGASWQKDYQEKKELLKNLMNIIE